MIHKLDIIWFLSHSQFNSYSMYGCNRESFFSMMVKCQAHINYCQGSQDCKLDFMVLWSYDPL